MGDVHESAPFVEAGALVWQWHKLQPGQEEACADEQLQQQAQVLEEVFPACLGVPHGMSLERERR